MSGIAYDNRLLKNIIFLESFSKSHGLCGERLGMYFRCAQHYTTPHHTTTCLNSYSCSANEDLFTKMHTANIAFSAGPGRHKGTSTPYPLTPFLHSMCEEHDGTNLKEQLWGYMFELF